jgi:hypothetical protein
MKVIRLYVLENGDGDAYAAPESKLKGYVLAKGVLAPAIADGKPVKGVPVTRKAWHEQHGSLGKWLCLSVHPASARIEKAINARCRIDHMLVGMQVDQAAVPGARFDELVVSWGHEDLESGEIVEIKPAPDEAAYLDLHPNVTEVIDQSLERHLRPSLAGDPDLLGKLKGR